MNLYNHHHLTTKKKPFFNSNLKLMVLLFALATGVAWAVPRPLF